MRVLVNIASLPYLMKILNIYFQDRKVIYLKDEGEQINVMTTTTI